MRAWSAPSVVDRYQALLWAKVFKSSSRIKTWWCNKGGDIAWMIRKESPKLQAEIAAFAKEYGQKSDVRECLVKKYAGSPRIREARDVGQ